MSGGSWEQLAALSLHGGSGDGDTDGAGSDLASDTAGVHVVGAPLDGCCEGTREGSPWQDYILDSHSLRRAENGKQARDLTVLSLCTGLCAEGASCKALGINVSVEAACDMKQTSMTFLANKPDGLRPKHFYGDVFELLENDTRECLWHCGCGTCNEGGGFKGLDLLIAGFPCQPYTQQNSKRRKTGSGLETDEHPLRRVTGAMITALRKYEPKGFIFEQVFGFKDILPKYGKSALDMFVGEVEALNKYYTATLALHLDVWVEASRSRLFIIGVRKDLNSPGTMKRITLLVDDVISARSQHKATPLVDAVLKTDAESTRRRCQKAFAARDLLRARSDQEPKWKEESAAVRKKLGVGLTVAPWTSRVGVSCFGLGRVERKLDVVDVAFMSYCKQNGLPFDCEREAVAGLFVNPTQAVQRSPWTSRGTLNTQIRRSQWYSFGLDRVFMAADILGTLGHPHTALDFLSEPDAMDLCGEAIAVQCMATVLHSVLMGANFPGLFDVAQV